jgi:putative methyltransferase (TIGR04325 family)
VNPKVRAVLKQWIPPALLRSLRRAGGARFGSLDLRGEFSSWQDAAASSSGYDDPNILAKVADATRAVRDGHAAYERDSVVFAKAEPSWPVVSALLWAAAMSNGRLSVLDFGGSLGSTYFQHRGLLGDLERMQWGIVEQAHFVQLGQREFQDTQLRFFNTIEECSAAIEPNAILLGSVLQYLNDPTEILRRLSATQATVLVVDRTPFGDIREDRITVQRVPESIYRASYPFRILSRDRTLAVLTPTWQLVAPIEAPEGEIIVSRTLKFRFEGFILHR